MRILWIEDDFNNAWLGASKFNYKHLKDFTEAHNEINENISDYDFVILDMNLEGSVSDTPLIKSICEEFDITAPQELLIEGGYYLFIKLIINKFPSDRIVCFTGNYVPPNPIAALYNDLRISSNKDEQNKLANIINQKSGGEIDKKKDEFKKEQGRKANKSEMLSIIKDYTKTLDNTTTASFLDRFKEARIPIPKIISKGDEKEKLPEYLGRFSNNHYILLRRGIINASHYFIQNTEGSPSLHSYIKVNSTLFSKRFDSDDAILLIESILKLLPIEEPNEEEKKHIIDEFIRLLAHHWESADPKEINNYPPEILARKSFVEIMKTVRNWSAHNKIFMRADYPLCTFIFLIQMRALFDFPNDTQDYENELLQILGDPCKKELWINKETILPRELTILYIQIFKDFSNENTRDFRVHQLINSALLESKNEITPETYLKSLYYYFWFQTAKPIVKPLRDLKNSNANVFQIEYRPFPFSKIAYLDDFARYIYTKTLQK
jgi:hypothetical protein